MRSQYLDARAIARAGAGARGCVQGSGCAEKSVDNSPHPNASENPAKSLIAVMTVIWRWDVRPARIAWGCVSMASCLAHAAQERLLLTLLSPRALLFQAAGIAVDLIRSKKMAGRAVLFAGVLPRILLRRREHVLRAVRFRAASAVARCAHVLRR